MRRSSNALIVCFLRKIHRDVWSILLENPRARDGIAIASMLRRFLSSGGIETKMSFSLSAGPGSHREPLAMLWVSATATVLAMLLTLAPNAHAITFMLGSPTNIGVGQDLTSVLYASGPNGAAIRLAKLGMNAPGGGVFSDFGVPTVAPDGTVVFAAEVTVGKSTPKWNIFRAAPSAAEGRGLALAIDPKTITPGCAPTFKIDPYPVVGSNGQIAFIAPDAKGKSTLFRYVDGELTCAARIGSPTVDGNLIREFNFGSAEMTPDGELAFLGLVDGGLFDPSKRRFTLMVTDSQGEIHEVASAGDPSPDGGKYVGDFSLPAIASPSAGTLVAYTAQTSHGHGLFLWQNGHAIEIIATGTRTPLGRVSYISTGRPGLTSTGIVAVSAVCDGKRALLEVRGGQLSLVMREGHPTGYGSRIAYFGDPGLTTSGHIMLGIADDEGRNVFYETDDSIAPHTPSITNSALAYGLATPMFGGSLAVNELGAYTFLGGE
jgi:hypothetical protein